MRLRVAVVAVATLAAAMAAVGCGDPAIDGPPTLGKVGSADADGCVAVATGRDLDGDGALSDDEVEGTSKLCGAVDGSTVRCASDAGAGKTLTGRVVIASDDDYAQLAGVTCIDGDLLVVGTDDPDLQSLHQLRVVTGNVAVAGNANITTLDALADLRAVGGALLVQGNDWLADLGGAAAIPTLPELDVIANHHLPDLSGLAALSCATTLRVADNPELASLTGLDDHTCIGDLALDGNPALDSLAALAKLREAGGLEIAGNPRLSEVALPALASVAGTLRIADEGVQQLVLPDLSGVGELEITDDDVLAAIDLPHLASASTLTIARDPQLSLVRTTLGPPQDVELSELPALSAILLGSVDHVAGDLVIERTGLASLSGFSLVGKVGGDLTLRANAMPRPTEAAVAHRIEVGGKTTIE